MKTDSQIQHDVVEELRWDAEIDEAAVGVAVKDGVVSLTGHVPTYTQKIAAEDAAKRVAGVRGVADEIEVRLPTSLVKDDGDIARTALNAFGWYASVPKDVIKVTVRSGWVTLEGEVDWQFQKTAAYNAVRNLNGVVGVSNMLRVKQRPTSAQVRQRIENALKRHAQLEANSIGISVDRGVVELTGNVSSWAERDEAERCAWNAPGVIAVDSHLSIAPRLMYV